MKSKTLITKVADGIFSQVTDNLSVICDNYKDIVSDLSAKVPEDGLRVVSDFVGAIESILKVAKVEGVSLPSFLSKVYIRGNDMSSLYVIVKSKLKAPYKYRKEVEVTVDDDVIRNVAQVYIDALFDMFYIEVAMENVSELNSKLSEIITKNGIPYTFEFVVDASSDAMVLEVDNNKVVFNADIMKAQDISKCRILNEGDDEYAKLVHDKYIENLVVSLKAIQTPVQLIKGNIPLIKEVTGVSTKKRASKLIRESYHRQAKYLDNVKTGIGYYNEDVEIEGNKIEVFALVGKAEDGTLNVVLNPFNVKDLSTVNFDVIEAVKAQVE